MADMVLLRTIITLIGAFSVRVSAQSSFGGRFGDTQDHDLLHAIQIPPKNSKTQFETGADGFPAYILKSGSDVKSPYRLFIPEKLYPEFGISAVVKPLNNEGGFLFSVVNPLEMVVQLGIEIVPSGYMLNNITLYYTDVNIYSTSQKIASFVVPSLHKKWTMFSLRVLAENVTLFLNCNEYDAVKVKRIPLELIFDSASTLYLGQAGPLIKGHFDLDFILQGGQGVENSKKGLVWMRTLPIPVPMTLRIK